MTQAQHVAATSAFTVQPLQSSRWQRRIGLFAALATVLIWSLYFLSVRFSVLSALTHADLLLMRYCAPGALLLPVFIRSLGRYRAVHPIYLSGIVFGSGIGFFLLTVFAMRQAGVIFASTLIPGTAPLFVTLLAITLFREQLKRQRLIGLGLISAGIFCMLLNGLMQPTKALLAGQALLLTAGLIWALFTISVRQCGLRPVQIAALVTVPNGFAVVVWILWQQPELRFMELSLMPLLGQVIVQGLLVGILSGLLYSTAISRLGAETTATLGSMTPVVATVLAALFLQEALEFIPLLGLCLTVVGVYIANRHQQS